MKLTIKVTKITILRMQSGSEIVSLRTEMPEATYPYKESLDLEFRASREQAEDYVKKHFPGVPVEVL